VDVYDGANNQPEIFHQKTLTSKMLFEDALIIIKEYGFKLSEYVLFLKNSKKNLNKNFKNLSQRYPLIITIELHCSPEQQKVMADLIKKYLGGKWFLSCVFRLKLILIKILEFLYVEKHNVNRYPTLNELKRKVLIRVGLKL